ncbi:MAG: DUF58 domain-containing protein [Granulosicoccus sp.]
MQELIRLRQAATALQRQAQMKSLAPMSGGSVSRKLGRGLEFAEVREYQPGDDVRMIDWKVTARSGKAHTKLFVEERERPVLLLVDLRGAMRFGTRGVFKSVLASRLAALLGWCSVSAHDRVGGFVFTDDWHREIRPQSGRRGLMSLFQAMHQGEERESVPAGEQLTRSLSRLRHSVHAGSTVVLLSDFSGFNDKARDAIGSVLHTMDIIAIHISDPLEQQLPRPGLYPIVAGSLAKARPSMLSIHSNEQRERYEQRFNARQMDLKALFAHQRHQYYSVSTAQPLMSGAASILSRKPMDTGSATSSRVANERD